METVGILVVSALLFAIIGCIHLPKFWQSLVLIVVTSFLAGFAVDQNMIFTSFDFFASGKSFGFFMFAVSLTFNLMTRTDMLVDELKKEEYADKESIIREKWNFFMFPIYWFFWALCLTVFIQLNFYWGVIVVLSVLVAGIMFLLWIILEERLIVVFSITMSIISLSLFAMILF